MFPAHVLHHAPTPLDCLCILQSCASFTHFLQIHAQLIRHHLTRDPFIASKLLEFCAAYPHGSLSYARKLFDEIPHPNVFAWNSLIRGHASSPNPSAALHLFHGMLSAETVPNSYTYPFALKACARIFAFEQGEQLHGFMLKSGADRDVFAVNGLISMYCACGHVELGQLVFDTSHVRDVASWNSMLSGYIGCGFLDTARNVFDEMPVRGIVSWNAMINGYVKGGYVGAAKELFDRMPDRNVESWNTLIAGYAKCGQLEKARTLFDDLPHKDVFSWSAIIGGLAVNGHGAKALEFFSMMERDGVRPNDVTFVGVLCACSHGGMVDLAKHYFNSMSLIYGIKPQNEHYGCMVDSLGRAGLLHEAVAVVESIPGKGNSVLWVTLLGASWIHGNLEVGEMAVQRLIELKPNDGGVYVIMSNIYAEKGMWYKAREARMLMKSKGLNKEPSQSLIEACGTVHEFDVGNQSYPETPKIYRK